MADKKEFNSAQIEIKNREEYLKLPENEKKYWVIYNPSSSDGGYNELVKEMSAMKSCLDDIKVTYEQMKADPMMMKTQQYAAITSVWAMLIKALEPIVKLINDSVVGVLVKPLVDFLKLLLKTIGSIVMILATTIKQAWVNGEAVVENLKAIDYDGIFKENYKKAVGGKSEAEIDWDLIAMKENEKKQLEKELKLWKTQLEADNAWKEMVKARKAELLANSIDSLCKTLVEPWAKVLDIDVDKLIGYDEEALAKIAPNPTLASMSIAKKLNKLAENKYIQKKDLSALENYYMQKKTHYQLENEIKNSYEKLREVEKEKLNKNEITLRDYERNIKAIDEKEKVELSTKKLWETSYFNSEKERIKKIINMSNEEYELYLKNEEETNKRNFEEITKEEKAKDEAVEKMFAEHPEWDLPAGITEEQKKTIIEERKNNKK